MSSDEIEKRPPAEPQRLKPITRRRALKVLGLSAAALVASSARAPRVFAAGTGKPTSYRIVYHLNGGKNPKGQILEVKRGKSILVRKLKKPKRAKYDFMGWYTDKGLTVEAKRVRGKKAVAARRLYAEWEPSTYQIVFNLRGGENPANQVKTVKRGKSLSTRKLKAPKRAGYDFIGWFDDETLSEPAEFVEGVPAAEFREVYADWSVHDYRISYDMGGGSQMITLPTSYTINSEAFSLPRPIRDGYRFGGWFSDAGLTNQVSKVEQGSTGDLLLRASWEPVDYWTRHLDEKCSVVNELAAEAKGTTAQFVFITDMHLPSNALVSPYLVRQVIGRTGASMVVFGGDALNFHAKRSNAVELLGAVRTMFSGLEFHYVRGNHDTNAESSSNATAELTLREAEVLELTRGTNEMRDGERLYYYRDDEARRIRYFFLDSGVKSTARVDDVQLLWLEQHIRELRDGWTVLIMVHRFFAGNRNTPTIYLASQDNTGKALVKCLDKIYDSVDATIAGVICGHCHRDYAEYPSKLGYPYFAVATTCDAYDKVTYDPMRSRTAGTDDEQVFDVVTLDLDEKMAYFTRVGWGSDRCFSWAAEDALPDGALNESPSAAGKLSAS